MVVGLDALAVTLQGAEPAMFCAFESCARTRYEQRSSIACDLELGLLRRRRCLAVAMLARKRVPAMLGCQASSSESSINDGNAWQSWREVRNGLGAWLERTDRVRATAGACQNEQLAQNDLPPIR